MSKMGSHDPFGHLKHVLWPKEGSGFKLPIWLLTIKSRELLWFPYVQVACHITLERSWWGYNFASNVTSIEGLHTKLWASKVVEVPISKISGFQLGSLKIKWHLSASPVARHKEYYKGEGGGFLKSRPWWIL